MNYYDSNGREIKVGDIVEAVKPPDGNDFYLGKEGEVCAIHLKEQRISINVKYKIGKEDLGFWNCEPDSLRILFSLNEVIESLDYVIEELKKK